MLDALARFISRYAKIIFAVWVVAILVMVPTAVKGFDTSDFSVNDMTGESSEGQRILEEHFHSTGIGNNPVLVLSYNTPEGYNQFRIDEDHFVVTYVLDWFKTSPIWLVKLNTSGGVYVLDYSLKPESGLVAIGFTYREGTSFENITNDTANLRSAVNEAISGYLSDIAVPNKQFNSYVTGNSAIAYDSKTETVNTLTLAAVIVLIIAVVLMGLFFGSAMTSVLTVVSISFSAVLCMFLMQLLTSFMVIPTAIWMISMFLCVAMSFALCVLFVSTFRGQLLMGVDRDSALTHSIVRTGTFLLYFALCILAVGLVFVVFDSNMFRAFGLCLMTSIVSVTLVSLMVPGSMINVTKNELFWTRNSDGTYKSKTAEKVSPAVDKAFEKVSYFSERFSSKGCIAIIVAISLIAVGSAAYVISKDGNSDSYDLTSAITTGESKAGLQDLSDHDMGGVFQPFSVVLQCGSSIGTVKETKLVEELPGVKTIEWNSNASATYQEVQKLRDALEQRTDTANIYSVTTFEMWDELVKMAEEAECKTPEQKLDFISGYLYDTNIIAYQGLRTVLDHLEPLLSPLVIVNVCGPLIDYVMNSWVADLGSNTGEGDLTIDYIVVSVFTKDTCTSDKVIDTTNKIHSTVDAFMKDSKCISKSYVTGVGVSYSNMYEQFSSGYYIAVAIAIVLILLILCLAVRDVIAPIAIVASSIISTFISTAIVMFVSIEVTGALSNLVLMVVPIFGMTFCIWFGYMQIAMMRNCGSISDMKKSFNPVIIVTSLVIAAASFLTMFSDMSYISQVGFTVAVLVLVDAFVIRMLFSPAVWKLGINHNIKFFEKYSH